MNRERFGELMYGDAVLTSEELLQGYHFCPDWDDLVIGSDCDEFGHCHCFTTEQKAVFGWNQTQWEQETFDQGPVYFDDDFIF